MGGGTQITYRRQRCVGGGLGCPLRHQAHGHVAQRLHWSRVSVPCVPVTDLFALQSKSKIGNVEGSTPFYLLRPRRAFYLFIVFFLFLIKYTSACGAAKLYNRYMFVNSRVVYYNN
jgi:hypothetical protein